LGEKKKRKGAGERDFRPGTTKDGDKGLREHGNRTGIVYSLCVQREKGDRGGVAAWEKELKRTFEERENGECSVFSQQRREKEKKRKKKKKKKRKNNQSNHENRRESQKMREGKRGKKRSFDLWF